MGEQSSNSTDRLARAYVAIMAIAHNAALGGTDAIAVFRGYAEAVGVFMGAGGWTYSGIHGPHSTALAQGG